ncbi:MAG: hypothetical protein ACLFO6_08135, partial [Archaeoglobaceae archaeon]
VVSNMDYIDKRVCGIDVGLKSLCYCILGIAPKAKKTEEGRQSRNHHRFKQVYQSERRFKPQ